MIAEIINSIIDDVLKNSDHKPYAFIVLDENTYYRLLCEEFPTKSLEILKTMEEHHVSNPITYKIEVIKRRILTNYRGFEITVDDRYPLVLFRCEIINTR